MFIQEFDLDVNRFFGLDLGDLDGDNDLDIFLIACCGNAAKVWLNQGDGTFIHSMDTLKFIQGVLQLTSIVELFLSCNRQRFERRTL